MPKIRTTDGPPSAPGRGAPTRPLSHWPKYSRGEGRLRSRGAKRPRAPSSGPCPRRRLERRAGAGPLCKINRTRKGTHRRDRHGPTPRPATPRPPRAPPRSAPPDRDRICQTPAVGSPPGQFPPSPEAVQWPCAPALPLPRGAAFGRVLQFHRVTTPYPAKAEDRGRPLHRRPAICRHPKQQRPQYMGPKRPVAPHCTRGGATGAGSGPCPTASASARMMRAIRPASSGLKVSGRRMSIRPFRMRSVFGQDCAPA